jgi:hypothetical protein
LNGGVWAVPGEIAGVSLTKGASPGLVWSSGSGGSADVYDIAGGTIGAMRADAGVGAANCLQNDNAGTSWPDPRSDPAAGQGYYYLVRAQNLCGTGTYGSATAGGERLPASACP